MVSEQQYGTSTIVVQNPDQREMAKWPGDESDGECDSDEDESCAWLYE